MEVSALKPTAVPGLRGPTALLRLQSDERLIALVRSGHHAAFEVLFSRYRTRLLAFCRHMLGSREDAEDVLQEVFAAAFNAILADERDINVRPWLYRIARNRSLNHLRRSSAIGMDSMDVHYAENGMSTAEKVMRRESFRQLIGDVRQLPETQRTALLLREIDALSYEQIAHAMETTVPAVKSLLVRARISLAEATEARKLTCEQARVELGEAAEGLVKTSAAVRRHVRDCERCRAFRKHLKDNNVALAAIFPVGPLLLLKKLALTKLGSASAGGAHVASAGGAAAGASAAGGLSASGGILTAGTGALATKAVAGLAVAAIVTAGTVEAEHSASAVPHHHHKAVATHTYRSSANVDEPVVTSSSSQPVTVAPTSNRLAPRHPRHKAPQALLKAKMAAPKTPANPPASNAAREMTSDVSNPPAAKPKPPAGPLTQVTTETAQLPSSTATTASSPDPVEPSPTPHNAPAAEGSPPVETTQTTTTTTTVTTTPLPPTASPEGEGVTPPSEPESTTTGSSPEAPGASTNDPTTVGSTGKDASGEPTEGSAGAGQSG